MRTFQVRHRGPVTDSVPADKVMGTSVLRPVRESQGADVCAELGKRYYARPPDQPAQIKLFVAGAPFTMPEHELGLNASDTERGAKLLASLTARLYEHLTKAGVEGGIAGAQAEDIAGLLASDGLWGALAPLNGADAQQTGVQHTRSAQAINLSFEGQEIHLHLTTMYTSESVKGPSKVEDLGLRIWSEGDYWGRDDTQRLTAEVSQLAVRVPLQLANSAELAKFGVTTTSTPMSSATGWQQGLEWVERVCARVYYALCGYRTMQVETGVPVHLATPNAWARPAGIELEGLTACEGYYLIAATPAGGWWPSDTVEYQTVAARVHRAGTELDNARQTAASEWASRAAGREHNHRLSTDGKLSISHWVPMSFPQLDAFTYRYANERFDELAAPYASANLNGPKAFLAARYASANLNGPDDPLVHALGEVLYGVFTSSGGGVTVDGQALLTPSQVDLLRTGVSVGDAATVKEVLVEQVIAVVTKAVPDRVAGSVAEAAQMRRRVLMTMALAWAASQPVFNRDGAPQITNNESEARTINILTQTEAGKKDGSVRLDFGSFHPELAGHDAQVTVGGQARRRDSFETVTQDASTMWWVRPPQPPGSDDTGVRSDLGQGIFMARADYTTTLKLSSSERARAARA